MSTRGYHKLHSRSLALSSSELMNSLIELHEAVLKVLQVGWFERRDVLVMVHVLVDL